VQRALQEPTVDLPSNYSRQSPRYLRLPRPHPRSDHVAARSIAALTRPVAHKARFRAIRKSWYRSVICVATKRATN